MEELEEIDMVQRVEVGQGIVRYEAVREGHGHHHHLVCDRCGRTQDVHVDASGLRLPRRERGDFVVGSAEIVFRGVCSSCSRNQKETAREESDRRV
jgi:Fur family ferric uptake transcriptional regulator